MQRTQPIVKIATMPLKLYRGRSAIHVRDMELNECVFMDIGSYCEIVYIRLYWFFFCGM